MGLVWDMYYTIIEPPSWNTNFVKFRPSFAKKTTYLPIWIKLNIFFGQAYLQELMVSMEEYSTSFRNQMAESGDVAIYIDAECDENVAASDDRSRVLDNTNITNATTSQTKCA